MNNCQYCGKEFTNVGSHERNCPQNPQKKNLQDKKDIKNNIDEKIEENMPEEKSKKEEQPKPQMRNAISIVVGDVSIGIETTDSSTEQTVEYGLAILQGIAELRGGVPEIEPENPEPINQRPSEEPLDIEGQKEYEKLMEGLNRPDRKIIPPGATEPAKKPGILSRIVNKK